MALGIHISYIQARSIFPYLSSLSKEEKNPNQSTVLLLLAALMGLTYRFRIINERVRFIVTIAYINQILQAILPVFVGLSSLKNKQALHHLGSGEAMY